MASGTSLCVGKFVTADVDVAEKDPTGRYIRVCTIVLSTFLRYYCCDIGNLIKNSNFNLFVVLPRLLLY